MRTKRVARSEASVLAQVWKTNDSAAVNYLPRCFPGVITDFRPMKQYTKYAGENLKWSQLALGGQKIVTLPVYPAGMLLEPFVEHLAAALRTAIDQAAEKTMCLAIPSLYRHQKSPPGRKKQAHLAQES